MQRRPSSSTARLGLLGVLVLVEIGDGDVGAFAREQHGHGAADAGIAAGDQRHLALQLARALVEGRVVHRRRVELGLDAGLLQVLLGKRRLGIVARAGLRRRVLVLGLERALLLGLDLGLDGALAAGDAAPCSSKLPGVLLMAGLLLSGKRRDGPQVPLELSL